MKKTALALLEPPDRERQAVLQRIAAALRAAFSLWRGKP
jgi:hypothetical protein